MPSTGLALNLSVVYQGQTMPLEDLLYRFVRNEPAHEAELPGDIVLLPDERVIFSVADKRFTFSVGLLFGLARAIAMTCPVLSLRSTSTSQPRIRAKSQKLDQFNESRWSAGNTLFLGLIRLGPRSGESVQSRDSLRLHSPRKRKISEHYLDTQPSDHNWNLA
jgi:hypothetical protein